MENINVENYERMEKMAKMFNMLNEEQQAEILKMFDNEEDKITFMKCMSIYKLMTDTRFYNEAKRYVAERLYVELNAQ